jgi:hypothetical protein
VRRRASGLRSEKVNARLLRDRLASTQGESAVVNTIKLLNYGLGVLYYGWEISRQGSRMR